MQSSLTMTQLPQSHDNSSRLFEPGQILCYGAGVVASRGSRPNILLVAQRVEQLGRSLDDQACLVATFRNRGLSETAARIAGGCRDGRGPAGFARPVCKTNAAYVRGCVCQECREHQAQADGQKPRLRSKRLRRSFRLLCPGR